MHLSLNFVKKYVKLPDADAREIALALTMSTVEVEEIIEYARNLHGVVVGRVAEAVKHPRADRLLICTVDIGTEELQVVCGGSNVTTGMLVAFATVGSRVRWHGGGELVELGKTKIRGIESSGMIVSSDEIGLEKLFPKRAEREILDLTAYRLRVGEPLSAALGMDDTILVIDSKSMTHRPDLWGQYGLARELAAIFKMRLKTLRIPEAAAPASITAPLQVTVENQEDCPVYTAIALDNITLEPSPLWLRRELESCGIHSINNIVDVTNYVMLITGQPLHAFDYEQIRGHDIQVRRAGKQEKIQALNGKEYTIMPHTLTIRDRDRAIAIAGIVGGVRSSVTERTKTIVLESANFSASLIRKSSLAMGLRTEASTRFEKKLDPQLARQALLLAVDLIQQVNPGAVIASSMIGQQAQPVAGKTVEVSMDFLDSRLGMHIDARVVMDILRSLEFGVSYRKGIFQVTVPSFRQRDIALPEDVLEEVARIYGYDNIEPAMPKITMAQAPRDTAGRVEQTIKRLLTTGFGYSEIYNYSFANIPWSDALSLTRQRIALQNYVSPEHRFLRASLLPGLLARSVDNRRWFPSFRIFELGRIFQRRVGEFAADAAGEVFLPRQPLMLSGVSVGGKTDSSSRYRDVKGMLQHIYRHLNVKVQHKVVLDHAFGTAVFALQYHEKILGHYGFLKQEIGAHDLKGASVVWWDVDFDLLVKFADFARTFKPLPKYPSVTRDLAVIVSAETQWADIEKIVAGVSPLLRSWTLFDVFTSETLGSRKKSVAFSMAFGSDERTLESSEVDAVIHKLSTALRNKLHAVIR